MPYDAHTSLWIDTHEVYFRDKVLTPQLQTGPHCVATSLAMLTGTSPDTFIGTVNTQNPASWSDALAPWHMQLAYCPTDTRKLKYYRDELGQLDDLFTLSYYTTSNPVDIFADPNERGWITGSHVIVLHRNHIYDPARGTRVPMSEHSCWDKYTKRIFRLVPLGYARKL